MNDPVNESWEKTVGGGGIMTQNLGFETLQKTFANYWRSHSKWGQMRLIAEDKILIGKTVR